VSVNSIIRAARKPKLPTRVLDLDMLHDDDVICLRTIQHDGDKIADYVALSYCWGSSGEKAVVTTKENLALRRARIFVASLSKTLQDAIAVTRRLDRHTTSFTIL